MHNVKSSVVAQASACEASLELSPWVLPLIFLVFVLTLSWAGVFIVVNEFVDAASHTSLTMDTLPE